MGGGLLHQTLLVGPPYGGRTLNLGRGAVWTCGGARGGGREEEEGLPSEEMAGNPPPPALLLAR